MVAEKLVFGWASPQLTDQLRDQGVEINNDIFELCAGWDDDRKAISRLFVQGYLSKKERDNAVKRLHKKIYKEVNRAH